MTLSCRTYIMTPIEELAAPFEDLFYLKNISEKEFYDPNFQLNRLISSYGSFNASSHTHPNTHMHAITHPHTHTPTRTQPHSHTHNHRHTTTFTRTQPHSHIHASMYAHTQKMLSFGSLLYQLPLGPCNVNKRSNFCHHLDRMLLRKLVTWV